MFFLLDRTLQPTIHFISILRLCRPCALAVFTRRRLRHHGLPAYHYTRTVRDAIVLEQAVQIGEVALTAQTSRVVCSGPKVLVSNLQAV